MYFIKLLHKNNINIVIYNPISLKKYTKSNLNCIKVNNFGKFNIANVGIDLCNKLNIDISKLIKYSPTELNSVNHSVPSFVVCRIL